METIKSIRKQQLYREKEMENVKNIICRLDRSKFTIGCIVKQWEDFATNIRNEIDYLIWFDEFNLKFATSSKLDKCINFKEKEKWKSHVKEDIDKLKESSDLIYNNKLYDARSGILSKESFPL